MLSVLKKFQLHPLKMKLCLIIHRNFLLNWKKNSMSNIK
ncbi:hypothetical protein BH24BAC1_BH24BAC1_15700 [soil metagenome]